MPNGNSNEWDHCVSRGNDAGFHERRENGSDISISASMSMFVLTLSHFFIMLWLLILPGFLRRLSGDMYRYLPLLKVHSKIDLKTPAEQYGLIIADVLTDIYLECDTS